MSATTRKPTSRGHKSSRSPAGQVSKVLARLFTWTWVTFSIGLVLWLVLAAFKRNDTVFGQIFALPESFRFENFVDAWNILDFNRSFVNTILVVGVATVLTVGLAAPAAYALSRFHFKGAGVLTVGFAIGIGVPVQTILIPLFIGLARTHLTNSLVGLTLVYIGISLPFAVFLLTPFFGSLPKELEEAALVDGAGPVRTFRSVMLPLAQGGLITAGIFTAVGLWNEFLFALTLLIDEDKRTLSLTLLNTYGAMRFTSNWVGLFAGVVIVVVPILVIYAFLSRRIIEGITLGSGK